ncbi:MarR family transcriptional regulator [Parafrankia colletiae]|uniref:MarR family transcriptional regulator n=1 Tax=Parafrankia colletiae TaxID=573497 RepID=A0A1S1QQG4_9ACTN|nr:MarR family winged helix-turn-helix transcriptional regulator [Parafrankia colletiae]MCK9900899.1 MarR family winged helix-turn-helix transcriptional regulator [Frankia sp. Cpl3]OHV34624.1 MarR family transcriptional regulator [Parafrankia colletiae]
MYRPFAAPTTPALLQMVARRQAARVAEGFAAAGLTDLRPGHAQLLVPLLGGGRRVSELADGLGVTRQAVAQAVTVLERGGYVERVADPDDGRARLVCLTPHGMTALRAMRRTALTLEGEWSRHLGPDGLDQLRELLTALLSEDGGGSRNGAGNTAGR